MGVQYVCRQGARIDTDTDGDILFHTRATMAYTKGSDPARASGTHKVRRSPDWSLQLDSIKTPAFEGGDLLNQLIFLNI